MVAWKIPGDSVFVPNVVTPNGDQWNEYFEVYLESGDEFSMKVFNRYGQEVWSGDNANPRWDPSEAAAGTYFWMLTSHSKCSDRRVTKGWVQVLKE